MNEREVLNNVVTLLVECQVRVSVVGLLDECQVTNSVVVLLFCSCPAVVLATGQRGMLSRNKEEKHSLSFYDNLIFVLG